MAPLLPRASRRSTGTKPSQWLGELPRAGLLVLHRELCARLQGGVGNACRAWPGMWGTTGLPPASSGPLVLPHPEPGGGGPVALPRPPEAPRPDAASRCPPHDPRLSLSLSLSLLPSPQFGHSCLPPQVPLILSLPFLGPFHVRLSLGRRWLTLKAGLKVRTHGSPPPGSPVRSVAPLSLLSARRSSVSSPCVHVSLPARDPVASPRTILARPSSWRTPG